MITSKDNPHLKHARAVRAGKIPDQMFIEGLRLCEEADNSGIGIVEVLYTSDFADDARGKALLARVKNRRLQSVLVADNLLDSVTDTKTPQGIVIIAEKPKADKDSFAKQLGEKSSDVPLVLILHEMNNPSNLGAILRTAEAAGAAGVIVTKKAADPFSPKSLRGAMGANLRMPIWDGANFSEAIEWAKGQNMLTVCADINGKSSYTEIEWKTPHALVIGSEAHGLSKEELALCDESFRIPMAAPVESLNAAVAAGIVLFEARRAALSGA